MKREHTILLFLTAVFVTALVISNVITVKTISVLGLVGPAGIISYSLTFTITDTISELYGKKVAQTVILIGLVCMIMGGLMIYIAGILPGSPFWQNQAAYDAILGSSLRIVLASITAYYISQTYDVWSYHLLRRLTNKRMLWLRNNGSTLVSQGLDTSVFIIIAFWGSGAPILEMIFGNYVLKLMIAILDTPLVYLLVHKLSPHVTEEEYCNLTDVTPQSI